MNIASLLRILRARRRIFFMTLGIVFLTVLGASLLLPKTYKATAQVVLDYRGTDPVAGVNNPAYMSPGYMNTYIATQIDIIKSRHTALRVIDDLGLDRDPDTVKAFQESDQGRGDLREWLVPRLLKKLDVDFARDSSVMAVTFRSSSAYSAAAVANAFAENYRDAVIKLKAEPLQSAASYLTKQVSELRDQLENAQRRLSAYQQREGLVAGTEKADIETDRLNTLSAQLLDVQAQLAEVDSRYRQLQRGRLEEAPDIIGNPLVQSLKSSLSAAQVRLAQISERYLPTHPHYVAARTEVDKLRNELRGHINATRQSVANTLHGLQMREEQARAAFDQQKALVLRLRDPHDQLNVLAREVENSQKAFDLTMQRLNQTTIESKANQTNVSLLERVSPPLLPASPRLLLNLLLAVFLGTVLGVGLALIVEMYDYRLRSADQLARITGAPVFISERDRQHRRQPNGGGTKLLPYQPSV